MPLARGLQALLRRAAARPIVLLLVDFDGTLAPIRPRPELARITQAQRATLARLARGRSRVAIVSGRSLRSLRMQVKLRGVIYAGNFGLEISAPRWTFVHPDVFAKRREVAALVARARRTFHDMPSVLVEDKGGGFCVHHRLVPPSEKPEFERRLQRLLDSTPAGIEWRRALRAWEVLPKAPWDKGRAALLLWERLGRPWLIALGDDRFDEPMFEAVRSRGAAIRVGRGRSTARHRLKAPPQVHRFLRRLKRALATSHRRRVQRALSRGTVHRAVTGPSHGVRFPTGGGPPALPPAP